MILGSIYDNASSLNKKRLRYIVYDKICEHVGVFMNEILAQTGQLIDRGHSPAQKNFLNAVSSCLRKSDPRFGDVYDKWSFGWCHIKFLTNQQTIINRFIYFK